MSDLRAFNITGTAASAYLGGAKKKRVTRKKGGEGEPPAASVEQPVEQPVKPPVPPITTITRQDAPAPSPPIVHTGGDDKKIKVELKKKAMTKKVHLHPKEAPKVPKKTETRKKNRRVLLGVASLHKRMTRAKKMQKTAKEMPLDKLKEELIRKKLIKPTSRAPESVLRQIAGDAQIVESKSL